MISLQQFQSLIDNYEEAIKEISKELDEYRIEQNTFKLQINTLLTENEELNRKLENLYRLESSNDDINLQYKENDFIKNLQQQLNHVNNEKENVVKLWQNARETVEYLEEELKIYQNNLDGFVPKQELLQMKSIYEAKINKLENSLKLKQNLTTNTIKIDQKQCNNDNYSYDENNLKIIHNLEEEILKLQDRLNDCNKINKQFENNLINKNDEIDLLKIKQQECCLKVQEAVMIAESAINERDAALLREMEDKNEIKKLTEIIEETTRTNEMKFKNEIQQIHNNFNGKLNELEMILKQKQEEICNKTNQIDKLIKDLEIYQKHDFNDNSMSKLLILEKNLENTFQKLLFSEKQNIQLKSENESIKNDLNQMSFYYERDVKNRDIEKIQLKNHLKQLEIELNETRMKLKVIDDNNEELKMTIITIENNYQQQLNQQKSQIEDDFREKINKMIEEHDGITTILKQQLLTQRQLNRKWRLIINDINQIFDKRLLELKQEIIKLNEQNKSLLEKLKISNNKINEYKQLLQTITKDVGTIC